MKKILLQILLACFCCSLANAQLVGVKSIPGDYSSIAAAIGDLNLNGVGSGGVTFNIAAGYTETGNHTITATGTAANPIVFQKSGTGSNPNFTAGVGTGWDAIFKMVGSDYITFDGLTLQENPANANTWTEKTEYGFAFLKVDQNNGCQHNTIKNCSISLDRMFLQSDPSPAAHMAIGIYFYNRNANYLWINAESSVLGTHSYNTISNNTINNVGIGIQIYGFHNTSTSIAVIERENIITNNTITDVGGFNASTAGGISIEYAANCTITGNSVTTHVSHQSGCYGILYRPFGLSGVLINNNTVQVNSTQVNSFTTVQFGITVTGGSTQTADPGWKTIEIKNNTILAASANRGYTGINCQYNIAEFCTIENNDISLTSNATYDGTSYGIQVQNWWSHITQVSIKNNVVKNHVSSLAQLYAISCEDNTDVCNLEGNKIINNNGAIFRGIFLFGENASVAQKNIIDCSSTNTVGQFTGIQIAGINNSAINNLISCRAGSNGTTVHFGIASSIYTTTGNKIFNNTVYLEGGNASGPNYSTCLSINSANLLTEIQNNIFINKMQPGTYTPGYVSAFFSYQNPSPSSFISKNNIFYAGTPSYRTSIYSFGVGINSPSALDSTLLLYKLRVCAKDVDSKTGDISFLSFNSSSPNFLHIDPAIPSLANNNGLPIATVVTDFDGDSRSATTPDIGADEFSGTTAALTAMQTMPVLWLKADAGVFTDAGSTYATDGQTVQQWNDQSCNGYNAAQTDASKRPTWQQNAINGKPALWFDGVNGNYWLENTLNTPVSTAGGARTYFVVAKASCSATGTYYPGGHLFCNRRTPNASTLEFVSNGSSGIYHGGNLCCNHPQVTSVNFIDGQAQPFVGTWRTLGAGNNLDFWFNGISATTANANFVEDNGSTGYVVGDRRDGFQYDVPNGRYDWQGHIAEIIVYDRALTEAERQSVETYLANKYQTTALPTVFNGIAPATISSNANQADASWKHTYSNTDNSKVVVSVRDNCLALGTINSTGYVDANAPLYAGIRFMRRHFVINPTTDPVGTKRVRLYYTNADFVDLQTYYTGLSVAAELEILKFDGANEDGVYTPADGTTVTIPPSAITRGSVFGVNYLEFDVSSFSEFWIKPINSVPTPLNFLSFSVQKCNGKVCLNWQTADEENVSHFEIEKSEDGNHFKTIQTVKANNQTKNEYAARDNVSIASGSNKLFYRIKEVDNDGAYNFSEIRTIQLSNKSIIVAPTIVSNTITIQSECDEVLEMKLKGVAGNTLIQQSLQQGMNKVAVDKLSSGIYFYQIFNENGMVISTGKIVKE